MERHVKLLKNGQDQTLLIPKEFELPGDEAILSKQGDCLIIRPSPKKTLLEVLDYLDTLGPIEDDFPEIEDPPVKPEKIF